MTKKRNLKEISIGVADIIAMTNPQPKRRRGVVLTLQGWQRLLEAKRQSEIQENSSNAYTLEDLSERTSLSPNTLTRIQRRQVAVDRQSLEFYFNAFNLTLTPSDYTKLGLDQIESRHRATLKGQVPLDSPFYVERPPIEWLCYETILQPGALIRIKAPKQMGKTSLMARILQSARVEGLKTVPLSLQLADSAVFTDLNRFLQWFCAVVTRRLGLPNRVIEYWDEIFGSNYNCTDYFENYLLAEIESPIVLALDEVDVVFNYPEIATDFFGLLRAWYEKAKYGNSGSDVWEKLRLVVVHSTEVYIPLNINQSPFNVGLSVELPEFTAVQVQDLATRHGLDWGMEEVERLMRLTNGHPYLVQVALHHISSETIALDELLETATYEDGIYSDHLRRQLWNLRQYPDLVSTLTQVVMSKKTVELEPKQAFRLQSMGLVQVLHQEVMPSCGLYGQYFSDRLGKLRLNLLQENRLATIVFIGVVDFEVKMKADPEQTQNLLYQDFQIITQVSQQFEGQVLKSIRDGLLLYFPSVSNAVNCAQEIQLAFGQVAEVTSESVLTYRIGIHFGDVIFSYTDIMGTGVNIATRVQAEAPAGGICISQAVFEAVKNYLPLQPINIGRRQLEGIEEPMPLYQLSL
jgi:class 3 adenylate cyclase/transcriptional regulator with XRE-family HTH domain